jgi:hypothetical protein
MLLAFLSASLGVVLILNLRLGPSFGYGLLPEGASHEARERDYFFALAFVLTAAWAMAGVLCVAERYSSGKSRWWTVALALIPIALGASALNRRAEPGARVAQLMGETLLMNAPAGALLFLGGDNDSYPVWFAQEVKGLRRDVVPVTIPLLSASWYRDELARRHGVVATNDRGEWRGVGEALRSLARTPRPIAMSAGVAPRDRDAAGYAWSFDGALYHFEPAGVARLTLRDTMATALATLLEPQLGTRSPDDPTEAYVWRLLRCPSAVRARARQVDSMFNRLLETTCNYR